MGGPVAALSSGLADPGSAVLLHALALGELFLTHGGPGNVPFSWQLWWACHITY